METQIKERDPGKKALTFLAQLVVIKKLIDTLQVEIEKLLTRRLNPDTDAGRLLEDTQRFQQILEGDLSDARRVAGGIQKAQQILRKDYANLDLKVREQGGFRRWAGSLLTRRN